jgi:ribosomal protein S18 acetylase RimI-like enzyme
MAQPHHPSDHGRSSSIHIRPARAADEADFIEMSEALLAETDERHEPGAVASAWQRSLDPANPLKCRIAADESGRPIGFMLYVTHGFSWTKQPVCYFLDLYVQPSARKLGIGRALIAHLTETGRREGWARIYWMAREENTGARRLYEQIGRRSSLIRYEMDLPAG